MRIMVSQMNSVQEPGLIEKTQAWSAMEKTVLVSLLNCANVLSRAGEGERVKERKGEKESEMEDRQKTKERQNKNRRREKEN